MLFFTHIADEAKPFLRDSAYPPLLLTAITDRAPSSVDPGCNRRVRNNTTAPNPCNKVVFADDTITIPDQEMREVEDKRFDRDQRRSSTQLAPLNIENSIAKKNVRMHLHMGKPVQKQVDS